MSIAGGRGVPLQALLNFKRKSTAGFSIVPVLCDISGSVLALAQQVGARYLPLLLAGLCGRPARALMLISCFRHDRFLALLIAMRIVNLIIASRHSGGCIHCQSRGCQQMQTVPQMPHPNMSEVICKSQM